MDRAAEEQRDRRKRWNIENRGYGEKDVCIGCCRHHT